MHTIYFLIPPFNMILEKTISIVYRSEYQIIYCIFFNVIVVE